MDAAKEDQTLIIFNTTYTLHSCHFCVKLKERSYWSPTICGNGVVDVDVEVVVVPKCRKWFYITLIRALLTLRL